MTKKVYLIALFLFAGICGIVNSEVAKLMANTESTLKAGKATEPTALGSASGDPLNQTDYYTGNSTFWLPEEQAGVVISEYDPIIRKIASEKGYDWRLISAIANAESRFEHDAVSNAGAVGLMQVMPVVARQFKVDPMHIGDPHTNVTLGVELLDYIGSTIRFPESTPEKDRLSIILASYNCGMGHVLDARRLAAKYGENPNSWSVVARYLELKGEPEYYEDDVVRCGRFVDNRQTLGFVKKVMRYYDSYCQMAAL